MNDQIAYLLMSPISIYAMDSHRKDLYSTILKTNSERNRSTYPTFHHLIYGCEWTFLLALQTVWIDPDQDRHNVSLELDQNCLTL